MKSNLSLKLFFMVPVPGEMLSRILTGIFLSWFTVLQVMSAQIGLGTGSMKLNGNPEKLSPQLFGTVKNGTVTSIRLYHFTRESNRSCGGNRRGLGFPADSRVR